MTQETDSKLKILSVKILKGKDDDKPDDVHIGHEVHFPDGSIGKLPGEFNRQPHPDFKDALKKLRVHLAILCGQINVKQVNSEGILDKFAVHGLIMTQGKNPGFMIYGSFEGPYGRVALKNRNILFGSKTMDEDYPLSEQLISDMTNVRREAAEFIRGKRLPDLQGDLFATTVQIAKPVAFPENESQAADLYGQEPVSILAQAEAEAKERMDRENVLVTADKPNFKSTGIPQADPEAMKRVEYGDQEIMASSPESIVAGLVADANIKKASKRKVQQTAENKSGEISE